MPPQLSAATSGLKKIFAEFTAGQKAMTALAVVVLVVGGFLFTSWASKPALVPLFSNLAAADGAAITEELAGKGIKYELSEGGTTVLVPQKDVYQLRLDMSAAGLPGESKSGYGLLDEQGITTSEFRQRIDFQRALEGELSKTITAIDGVEAATVHLVMPEQALFSEDSRQPSASVLVKNKAGKTLTADQVQAVANLVTSSVEGLEAERVTIADAKGAVLYAAGENRGGGGSDPRTTQTLAFEEGLQQSVQDMLSSVVGTGKAVVRVKADLDFDKRTTRTESFETEREAPVVTETTGRETYTGTGTVVGGVLGPENVAAPEGGESNYEKEQTSVTRAVGKVTEQAVSAPGKVQRLSVAVLLDARAAGVVNAEQVQQIVAAATGLDPARGDVVQVSEMPFDDTAARAAEEEFAKLEAERKEAERWSLIRTVAILFVVGLLLLHALRVMRRDRRTPVELPVLELEPSPAQLAIDAAEAAALAEANRLALEPAPIDPDEAKRMAVQSEIGELVERQPEEVAQLLRGWLADRRS